MRTKQRASRLCVYCHKDVSPFSCVETIITKDGDAWVEVAHPKCWAKQNPAKEVGL